ncbi:MAG: LapB repeat-containing protein [Lachnospiraceae bacterium]|nr:LapB repeat-containing protein [Lachnospiraceae bacterium]
MKLIKTLRKNGQLLLSAAVLAFTMTVGTATAVQGAEGRTAMCYSVSGTQTGISAVPVGRMNITQGGFSRNVRDSSIPMISGVQKSYSVKQSAKPKEGEIKEPTRPDYLAGVSAQDSYDGDVSSSLQFDDTEVDYYTPGTYQVLILAKDRAGNQASQSASVQITDGKAPSIKIEGKSLSAKIKGDKSNFAEKILIKDNMDALEDLKIKIDDSKVNYKKYGSYTVTVTATDSSGNKNSKDFTVNIKDKKGPTIKCDKKSFSTTIGVPLDYSENITIKDGSGIKEASIDDSDIDYWTAGTYKLHVTATDKKGNASKKDYKVTVKDPEAEARAAQEAQAAQAAQEQYAAQTRAMASTGQTVYITRTGSKYHRGGCQYLRDSCIETSLSDAQAMGLTPCSRCY